MKGRRNLLWTAGLCALYVATARLGLEYAIVGRTVTLLWPPSGIALAATLIAGSRVWPGIALGALIANAGTGIPALSLLFIVLGNTLEPLWGMALLRRRNNFSYALDKVSDVLALFLFAAVIGTTASASLGTLGLFLGDEIAWGDFGTTWLSWWLGDGMGVLVISPVLLLGAAWNRSASPSFSPSTMLEALALIVVLTVVGQAVFGSPDLAGLDDFPVSLSLFPFAIWGALRFGPGGAAGVTLIASFLAISGTAHGTGPFAVGSAMESLIRWCLFADLMAITGLLLAAVASEREKALAALRNAKDDLERRVRQRTDELTCANLELQTALTARRRMQMEMNQIGEERQKTMGQELHDGLGQQLTGIALLVTSLGETLGVKSIPEVAAVRQVERLLGEAIAMVRSLSRGLYPVALESGGLPSALNHLAENARGLSGVQCTVRCGTGLQAIDKSTALNLYRIAQEAVSNALRHGKARRIEIELSGVGGKYALSVKDNGVGFPSQNPKTNGTLGLRSMQCRTELIGATFEVRENPDGGSWVVVTGPMRHEEQDIAKRK
ncbi:MAG TPA: MASE1 domain-containing protein [Methylococcaceae bacterium]|nr:MASE1 domain-containing protein [Methylococcaceae bacterium]